MIAGGFFGPGYFGQGYFGQSVLETAVARRAGAGGHRQRRRYALVYNVQRDDRRTSQLRDDEDILFLAASELDG